MSENLILFFFVCVCVCVCVGGGGGGCKPYVLGQIGLCKHQDQMPQKVSSDQSLNFLPYSNILDTQKVVEWTISNYRTSMVKNQGVPILRVNTVPIFCHE